MTGEVTYHSYQQILDLERDGTKLKQRRIRRKFNKSKDGCLNCKKRRKKCNEMKPQCTGCLRNKLLCNWPSHINRSEENTQQPEAMVPNDPISDEPFLQNQGVTPPHSHDIDNLFNEISANNLTMNGSFDTDLLLGQFLNIQTEINYKSAPNLSGSGPSSRRESCNDENGPNFDALIPDVLMTRKESICYAAFLNKFMTSITPPHCPPLVSPTNVILPFSVTHEMVREIFLACGATLVAYKNDKFKAEAHDRYVKVVNMLIQEIKNSKDGCEDHLFISVQLLQTLCLRDKNIALNATKTASHLSASYEIIKKRFLIKQVEDTSINGYQILPLDRVLTEHFLVNLPITIMLCRHDKLVQSVPSPFQFFEQFGSILSKPFNERNNDPWLNHPVLGLSVKAYELAAKCSWMCRVMKMPLRQEQLLICLELRNQANANLIYLNQLTQDVTLTTPQMNNISFSKSKLYACLIILKKLCNHETSIKNIQYEVKSMIREINSCKSLDPTFIHSVWGLFIGGSTSLEKQDQEAFKEFFKHDAEAIHSSLCSKIIKYLDFMWTNDTDQTSQFTKRHEDHDFNFLFDATILDSVPERSFDE